MDWPGLARYACASQHLIVRLYWYILYAVCLCVCWYYILMIFVVHVTYAVFFVVRICVCCDLYARVCTMMCAVYGVCVCILMWYSWLPHINVCGIHV